MIPPITFSYIAIAHITDFSVASRIASSIINLTFSMNESFIIGCCLIEGCLAYVENADDSSSMSKYHLQKGGAITKLLINSIMKYVKLLFEQLSFKFILIFSIFLQTFRLRYGVTVQEVGR